MSKFRKEKYCPSSFDLVEASCRPLTGVKGLRLGNHLAGCDFCAAELAFYQHYPPDPVDTASEPMPEPLKELAEALLARETIHISKLEYLLKEAA